MPSVRRIFQEKACVVFTTLKNGSSSKSLTLFDHQRFISFEAEKKFVKFMEDEKKIVRERTLKLNSNDEKILEFICTRHWEKLTDFPPKAIVFLVRKLYANALVMKENDIIFVRGKWVYLSPQAINAHYNLPFIEDDEDLYDEFQRDQNNEMVKARSKK